MTGFNHLTDDGNAGTLDAPVHPALNRGGAMSNATEQNSTAPSPLWRYRRDETLPTDRDWRRHPRAKNRGFSSGGNSAIADKDNGSFSYHRHDTSSASEVPGPLFGTFFDRAAQTTQARAARR